MSEKLAELSMVVQLAVAGPARTDPISRDKSLVYDTFKGTGICGCGVWGVADRVIFGGLPGSQDVGCIGYSLPIISLLN